MVLATNLFKTETAFSMLYQRKALPLQKVKRRAMTASDQKKYEECECSKFMLSVQDALDVLSGKWKLPILTALKLGNKRFKEISKATNGITDKVLARELKEMEANQLVTRTVYEAFPPKVEYSITEHALSLDSVLIPLRNWGNNHRKRIMMA